MNTQDFKRKLTAVFSADVAGYSRLMGEDEVATVRTLKEYREIISMHSEGPARNEGRLHTRDHPYDAGPPHFVYKL